MYHNRCTWTKTHTYAAYVNTVQNTVNISSRSKCIISVEVKYIQIHCKWRVSSVWEEKVKGYNSLKPVWTCCHEIGTGSSSQIKSQRHDSGTCVASLKLYKLSAFMIQAENCIVCCCSTTLCIVENNFFILFTTFITFYWFTEKNRCVCTRGPWDNNRNVGFSLYSHLERSHRLNLQVQVN